MHEDIEPTYTFALKSGETVTVDAADREAVEAAGPWHELPGLNTTYVQSSRRRPDGSTSSTRLHRLILDPPADMQVDHVNRNGLDNRRANLRVCTGSQNKMNSPPKPGCSSRYKGVSWDKARRKWRVRSRNIDGRYAHLGFFDNEETAARAYDVHASLIWGEFSWLNRDNYELERNTP